MVTTNWKYTEPDYPNFRAWAERNRSTVHISPCGCWKHRELPELLWVGDVRVNRATGEIVERFVSAAADAGVDNNAHVVEWLILESIKAHPGCRAERERMHGGWVDPA